MTDPTTHVTVVAGGNGGSWYVLMEGLARLVGEVHPELYIEVVEGGGVSNHARIGAGEVGEDGLHGEGVLDGGDDAQPAATAGTGEDAEVE
jgi:TRAP-type uncharacterized transport system substrate-binding protein